jgi:hypothetical protein
LFSEKKRKPIKMSVKREVYAQAGGKCQRCGLHIKWGSRVGVYHHTRSPNVSPTAKTVQLLCQNCHAEHGHIYKTIAHTGFLEDKEVKIKRKKVRKKRTIKAKTKKPRKAKTSRRRKRIKRK